MSARRQGSSSASGATPAPSSAARSRMASQLAAKELPSYVLPSAPLNDTAIATLDDLCRQSSNLQKLKRLQANAANHIHDATSAVFERTHYRSDLYEKGKAKLIDLEKSLERIQDEGDQGVDGDSSHDIPDHNREKAGLQDQIHGKRVEVKQRRDAAEKMKQRADKIYEEAELRIRQTIDGKARVQDYEDVLAEVSGNVRRGEGRVAPTQSTLGASQFYEQGSLPSTNGQLQSQHEAGVLGSVKRKLEQRESSYSQQTMRARYAEQSDYAAFKSVVHDALHQEDGVELPHSNTWFSGEDGEDDTGPSSTLPGAQTQNDDADSDIEIAGERIGTRCPITLVYMKDPITSPCKHNFEASAILEMLRLSTEVVGGQIEQRGRRTVTVGGEKIIRCPVTSCAQRFTENMLTRDPMMRRKIQRIQRQEKERERGGYDDEDNDVSRFGRAVSVNTDAGSRRETSVPRIKEEIKSSMASRWHRTPSMLRDENVNDDDAMDEDYDDA